jgi:prevent-host-death family protein
MTKTVKAAEFKAKCLQLMDEVARTGEPVTVTKRGKPVARLVPAAEKRSPFGFMKGRVHILGDIISPLDLEWDALR